MVSPGHHDRLNGELLARIPVNARAVLEVGCGSGALGAAFKAIRPDAIYVGLERDPAAAARAAGRLDHVICTDAEDPSLSLPALPPIDCLIYGGVLEQLRDPWACLGRHVALLDPEAVVLACIANGQHWSVLAELLQGRWPGGEQWPFDRTHLRWFTRSGIEALMAGCGLHLAELAPRTFDLPRAEAFVRRLEPALGGMGIDAQDLLAGVSPLQYLSRATLRPRPPLRIDAHTSPPEVGLVDVRILQPLRSLASLPGVAVQAGSGALDVEPAGSPVPRVFLWHRPVMTRPEALNDLRFFLRNGYVMVSEFDDDPDRWPLIAENGHLGFRGVHAVQVSTEAIAAKIAALHPEVMVFPNAIDVLPPPRPEEGEQALRARPLRLFFGAMNREADWTPWMEALNGVLTAVPGQWQVEVVHDEAFFHALRTGAKRFTPTCDLATYRACLGSCDAAFLPLAETPFNRCKSDLKALEAAAHGLAILASPTVYADTIEHGHTGCLFRSAAELTAALNGWRAEPLAMRAMGQRAREMVARSRLLHHQVAAREAWYRSLWDRREALTEQIYARIPELRS